MSIGAAVLWISSFIKTPASTRSKPVTFTVSSGQHLTAIAQNLKDQDLISNLTAFKLYVRIKKSGTRIKAGEYAMNTGMSPKTILNLLTSGKNKLYRITIPEGAEHGRNCHARSKSRPMFQRRFFSPRQRFKIY